MAQLVKLEPDDILVLANVGDLEYEDFERVQECLRKLGVHHMVIFAGDVNLSALPAGLSGALAGG
jgi:hypothetical protein